MCGINGIFAYDRGGSAVDREELLRSRDHMIARGPDDAGLWLSEDDRIGLGHRRLAIIDLSPAGAQPMAFANGRYMLSFNGEIYNYRELRQDLEARGVRFASQSDSEVILALYAQDGAAMVDRLRGMFAFAIWDSERGTLFLARDPLGIKPLYYHDDGRTLRFASQVKALIAGGKVDTAIEPAGLVGFYLWGHVPEPWTIRRNIFALPAGCTMLVDASGATEPRRYHSVSQLYRAAENATRPIDQQAVTAALVDSVRHHLIADVPVGCFLSAGVDSGSMLGLMRDAGQDAVQTVTIGFEEFRGQRDDEVPLAADVARYYGMPHHVRLVTEAEFGADLPRLLDAMDQPTIDGLNSWLVSKAAQELGLKVAISGQGGDELFGGYPSFRDLPRWTSRFAVGQYVKPVAVAARQLATSFGLERLGLHPKAAGMLEYAGSYVGAYLLRRGLFMPWELSQVLDPEIVRVGLERLGPAFGAARAFDGEPPQTAFGKVATLETTLYLRSQLLRDTDWASMAHSLEIRVPLVDSVLLGATAPMMVGAPQGAGKALLADAPTRALPRPNLERSKTGFSTPVGRWMKARMGEMHAPGLIRTDDAPWARPWAYYIAAHFAGGETAPTRNAA